MKRIRITISDEDIILFENERQKLDLSQAAFIKLLIQEYLKNLPKAIKYKDIISILSDINTTLNEILITKDINASTKILLNEKIKELSDLLNNIL